MIYLPLCTFLCVLILTINSKHLAREVGVYLPSLTLVRLVVLVQPGVDGEDLPGTGQAALHEASIEDPSQSGVGRRALLVHGRIRE